MNAEKVVYPRYANANNAYNATMTTTPSIKNMTYFRMDFKQVLLSLFAMNFFDKQKTIMGFAHLPDNCYFFVCVLLQLFFFFPNSFCCFFFVVVPSFTHDLCFFFSPSQNQDSISQMDKNGHGVCGVRVDIFHHGVWNCFVCRSHPIACVVYFCCWTRIHLFVKWDNCWSRTDIKQTQFQGGVLPHLDTVDVEHQTVFFSGNTFICPWHRLIPLYVRVGSLFILAVFGWRWDPNSLERYRGRLQTNVPFVYIGYSHWPCSFLCRPHTSLLDASWAIFGFLAADLRILAFMYVCFTRWFWRCCIKQVPCFLFCFVKVQAIHWNDCVWKMVSILGICTNPSQERGRYGSSRFVLHHPRKWKFNQRHNERVSIQQTQSVHFYGSKRWIVLLFDSPTRNTFPRTLLLVSNRILSYCQATERCWQDLPLLFLMCVSLYFQAMLVLRDLITETIAWLFHPTALPQEQIPMEMWICRLMRRTNLFFFSCSYVVCVLRCNNMLFHTRGVSKIVPLYPEDT